MTDTASLFAELTQAFNQQAWQKARTAAARLLPLVPNHPLAHYIAGVAEMELQNMPQALTHLHMANDLDPNRVDFAAQFAKALALVKMSQEARIAADRAMALAPADPITLDTLGVVYTQIHAHAQAAAAFRHAVALDPNHAPYRFNLATSLVAIGEIADAEIELEACIRIDPRWWKAHLTLSQLRRQTAASNHIARLDSLLIGQDENPDAQTWLHMALAKEHEDLADYPNAFRHYTRGKTAGGARRNYHPSQDESLFAAITSAFPSAQATTTTTGAGSNEPIFIIGMPRSGTTLVERIISSHPDVYSAGELMNFGLALKRASGSQTPRLLDLDTVNRAHAPDWVRLGENYVASTRPSTGHKPHFIDKLPHNFLYAGWIAHALPNAKIICLRRDPLDTCLSNFRQLFGALSPFYAYSFDLLDIGRYYVLFDRLMVHWRDAFPGRILEVPYEKLIEAQEASSRELLDFCGLPWHDACLHFEQNEAPVNTASAVQVRAPVYRSSLQRWRKYESQLDQLKSLLANAGIPLPH